jgi:transcription elongation factor Elf1
MPSLSFFQFWNSAMMIVFGCDVCNTTTVVIKVNGGERVFACRGCGRERGVTVRDVHPPVNLKMKLRGERMEAAG